MSVYISFYNVKGSPNEAELGPYSSVVCDGTEVVGIGEAEQETTLATYDQGYENWRIAVDSAHLRGCVYGYFEVYRR